MGMGTIGRPTVGMGTVGRPTTPVSVAAAANGAATVAPSIPPDQNSVLSLLQNDNQLRVFQVIWMSDCGQGIPQDLFHI